MPITINAHQCHFSRWSMWPHPLQPGAAAGGGCLVFPQPSCSGKKINCGTLTPKSLKILSESWATKLFWFLLLLVSSCSFNSNRKVHICRNEQLGFLCYNSSLDLKSVHVINHVHFTALTRTGLKFFTVFCYQWSFRLSLKIHFLQKKINFM